MIDLDRFSRPGLTLGILFFAACDSGSGPLAPTDEPEDSVPAPLSFNWIPTEHALGRGFFRTANVASLDPLVLTSPAGTRDGAEVHSDSLLTAVSVRARLDCPDVDGVLCALFFYQQGVGNRADEIDIEIIPQQRLVELSVWRSGIRVFQATRPWSPGTPIQAGIHREVGRVRFEIEGFADINWMRDEPLDPMPLYASIWWPSWLEGPVRPETSTFRVTELSVTR